MKGREPGNFASESPDIKLLSDGEAKFVGDAGGVVPPLLSKAFFDKSQAKYSSVSEWGSFVSSAAISFPPVGKVDVPYTYLKIAAYVLCRNCGKPVPSALRARREPARAAAAIARHRFHGLVARAGGAAAPAAQRHQDRAHAVAARAGFGLGRQGDGFRHAHGRYHPCGWGNAGALEP